MPFVATWVDLEIIILILRKSERGRQIAHDTWSLKMIQMNLFKKQKQTHKEENKLMVTKGKCGQGRWINEKFGSNM